MRTRGGRRRPASRAHPLGAGALAAAGVLALFRAARQFESGVTESVTAFPMSFFNCSNFVANYNHELGCVGC
jgi:hypothetical protein